MGGWGLALMTIGNLLFWGLIIAGIVALVRATGRGTQQGGPSAEAATPQRVLAERFARGEIDEEEYARRLAVLGDPAKTRPGG